ncbi:hypothetical protein [Acinetobacter sp. MB5]|uniref:hypothetical protein n=1 Tax=Acinetobacter sp. MB5 TaxID=2069438 RepID=UPI000DCFC130|nr:hypothetical protein [Acinetobacter sp. MB5]
MSKTLKISTFIQDVITIIVISAVIIIGLLQLQISHKDRAGSYVEGTDGYSGYTFARDNNLKSKAECEYAKLPPSSAEETSDEFMQGCHKYFEE